VGIIIGGLPMVLLTAGVDPNSYKVVVVAILVVGYQAFEALLLQRIVHRWSIRFGPALTVIVTMISFELYGIPGAVSGLMVAIMVVSVLDELAPVVAAEGQLGPAAPPAAG
jgi:predicted PurR-regulated permease PerM